jgi:hypothetical protein
VDRGVKVENADQASGLVDSEHDEPEVTDVRDPPSRHSGRRAEHRVVRPGRTWP